MSQRLFQVALGQEVFDRLPDEIRDLHDVAHTRIWSGQARVIRGTTIFSKIVCWLLRFPPTSDDVPVTVQMERVGDAEIWHRQFGHHGFQTRLSLAGSAGEALIEERFGILAFTIALQADTTSLGFPVRHGRLLGVPIPRLALPRSDTYERVVGGKVQFDVSLSLPVIGQLIRYQGELEPDTF